jgi:hypothetical protein
MKSSTNTALKGLAVSVFLSAGSLLVHAQVQPKVVLPPTVEGDWVRTDEVGVNTYHALDSSYGEADLTAEGKKLYDSFGRPQSDNSFADNSRYVGNISVVHPFPCIYVGGFSGLEYNSAGFHAVKTKNEVLLMGDGPSMGRHVYLDHRALPTPGTRTPSRDGYAVGTIEADGTLVVKTTDFTLGRVSGDGVRGPSTILTQRFEPSPDGKKLKIVYTWEDPKYYNKPHTYFMTFERMAANSTSGDGFCNATDTAESIT